MKKDVANSVLKGAAINRRIGGPIDSYSNNNILAILAQVQKIQTEEDTLRQIYLLAKSGISAKNISGLMERDSNFISTIPAYLEAFNKGRSECGTRIRARLLEAALEENSLQAAIYLDKMIGGDQVTDKLEVTVQPNTLDDTPTSNLIDILKDDNQDSN